MNYQESVAYLLGTAGHGTKDGTHNMRLLLERLGNPHEAYPCVHVAGTNGKGSIASMMARALGEHGLRTGLYTSPHLIRFNERIRVDGRSIGDEALAEAVSRVAAEVAALRDTGVRPTFFEVVTATAFTHFREAGIDFAVLEVGMGGRLDATNVVLPELSVITRIGLDHTKTLGATLAQIAGEKAGIVKPGVPVILYPQEPEAARVLMERAAACGCPAVDLGDSRIEGIELSTAGTTFDLAYQGGCYPRLFTRLVGRHQAYNAATAFAALSALGSRGWALSEDTIRTGIARAQWPGRMEMVEGFLLDGAHNAQGALALCESLEELLPEKPLIIVGMMADKDTASIIGHLSHAAHEVYAVAVDHPRAMPASEVAAAFQGEGIPAARYARIEEAVDAARGQKRPVIVAGSLYLVGAVRELLAGPDIHLT